MPLPLVVPPPVRRAAELAAHAHGAVSTRQLLAAGCTEDMILWMAATGSLHRLHQGVYAVGHPRLPREGLWMAATLAGGEGAVLSHISAAQLWEITRRRTTRIDISTPRYRRKIADVQSHLLRPLRASDATTHHRGVPVTTPARTIVDLAEVTSADELAFVMHEAAYRRLFAADDVQRVIEENQRFRGRGVLREALALHVDGHTGARSRFERRLHRYLMSVGVPNATPGLRVHTALGEIEVDLAWPDRHVYVEADGPGHRRSTTRAQDRERDDALEGAGWTGYRITLEAFRADKSAATEALRAVLR